MPTRSLPALALVCVLAAPCLGAERGDAAPDAREAVRAGNAFALRLYARLKDAPGNLFLSPYSLSSALAMTYLGARGDTQQAMAGGLGYPFHQEGRAPGRPGGTELVSVPPTATHMARTFAALRRAVVGSTGAGVQSGSLVPIRTRSPSAPSASAPITIHRAFMVSLPSFAAVHLIIPAIIPAAGRPAEARAWGALVGRRADRLRWRAERSATRGSP